MIRATENQGTNRVLANSFYQRSKVKDFADQQCSRPHLTPFHQETPMKPSQVPNRISYVPPKRILPFSSPDPFCKSKPNPHLTGPVMSKPASPQISSNSTHIVISSNMAQPVHKNKVGSPQRTVQTRPGPSSTPLLVLTSPVNGDTSPIRPQHSLSSLRQPAAREVVMDSNSHLKSCHAQGGRVTKSKHTLLNSGSKNGTAQGQESTQCQQLRCKSSSEKSNSVNSNCSSHKRRLESESCNEMNSKKLCFQGPNSGKTQATHPTADSPLGMPLISQPSTHSPSWEQPLQARYGPLHRESSEELNSSEPSSTSNPEPSHNSSSLPKHYTGMPLPMGAKQVVLHSTRNDTVTLRSPSYRSPEEKSAKKRSGAIDKNNKSDTLLTGKVPQKASRSSLHAKLNNNLFGTKTSCTSVLEKKRKSDSIALKSHSHFISSTSERRTAPCARKSLVLSNDIDELFTPDPCIVTPPHKTAKTTTKGRSHISPSSEKDCLSNTTVSPCAPITEYSYPKTQSPSSKNSNSPSLFHPLIIKQASAPSSQSPPQERQAVESGIKQMNGEDSMDSDLDLNLSSTLDVDVRQSSESSDDDQFIPFREIMLLSAKPSDTQERSAFSEPSTPGPCSPLSKKLIVATEKSGDYKIKNSHSQMLKEINKNKRAKEEEMKFLSACKKDLMRVSEYEAVEQNHAEAISTKDQEFLQRYSLRFSAIKDVPSGEEVFNLERFGQIFNQDSLQLRQCDVHPCGAAQKTLLRSTPAQLRLHVTIGLFQEAYGHQSPCPTQVSDFLFKMMSVHGDMMVSDGMLQALCDIALSAAYQRVNTRNQQFKVWVPSLADVTLILMNMGAAFVTLYPLENLQPPFAERDLLEDHCVRTESPFNEDQTTFPEHNCNNMLKYLSYCMGLCPHAYSDQDLLLLLTVVGRISLDRQLILQSSINVYPLLYRVVNNFRDWDAMLARVCLALTDVTDDHHNMCQLVHLLPNNKRGKQLRQHLSLCMISKLLEGNCTYSPRQNHLQLSELRPFIPRMRPSTLKVMLNSSGSRDEEDTLDQQAYYLCYSLLTLTNEVSNFPFYSRQKELLQLLSSDLDAHVKSDIRESGKCLYRSKVKDLQARISTKWEMLLKRTRPLNDQLYDWQPVDALMSSQEVQERSPASERSQ